MSSEGPTTVRALYSDAEAQRRSLDEHSSSSTESYQQLLSSAIATYEACLKLASGTGLFSPNEAVEDIATSDLEFLLINFQLGKLIEKLTGGDRKANLLAARNRYERFLRLLDGYDVLSKADAQMLERYFEDPERFSTASTSDARARRDAKIARFREEKALKTKIEQLRKDPSALQHDEAALRELRLASVGLSIHETFEALEGMAREMEILKMAPPTATEGTTDGANDERVRSRGHESGNGTGDGYSERLDGPSLGTRGWNGPLLSKDGKPLRPFVLSDKRTELRNGVFRPDHSLPTMSIDEYLEEERKRGGIIEGGGEKSGVRPDPEEDDLDKVDEEIMKQRRWDDWKDENPKGSGNTLNRG